MTLYTALLGVFVVLQLAVGLWIGRRMRGANDFFVAGRSLSAPLIFGTFLAANIGAGSTIGAASLGYSVGLGGWWWNASAGLGSLIFAVWAGPRLWELARANRFLTLGDFLEWRYGPSIRALTSVLTWFVSLSILAGQLLGASSILQVVAGLPRWVGAVTAAGVVVVYFVAGGLLSSAWVNLLQLAVKLSGFAIALPLALATVGGWAGLRTADALPDRFFDVTGGSGSTLWLLALLAPAFIVSPGLVQKAYGAADARAVRLGVGVNAVALLLFAIVPVTLGMVARIHHPDLPSADLALPVLLGSDLPPFVGALTLASVFAAEVSAADAVLFMLSTSMAQDLYRRFMAPAADDARLVQVARWSAGVAAAAGLGMALVLPTVVDALKIFYSVLTVALFVPVVAGLLSARPTSTEALSAMAIGLAAMLVTYLARGEHGVAGIPPVVAGLIGASVGFGGASAMRSAR
jgi:solute:Na+ symporter, SSS family